MIERDRTEIGGIGAKSIVLSTESRATDRPIECMKAAAIGRQAMAARQLDPADDLLHFATGRRFATILADPPWRFANRTGKMAPEHRRLSRYETLSTDEIAALPVSKIVADTAHLYLWVPMGSECFVARGFGRPESVGICLQDQYCLAQDSKRWGLRWPWRRILLPQRERAGSVWRARQECQDPRAWSSAGELHWHAQARALP